MSEGGEERERQDKGRREEESEVVDILRTGGEEGRKELNERREERERRGRGRDMKKVRSWIF